MTIDKCIEYFLENYAFDENEDSEAKHHNEVLDYTIDTLRKYQEILDIVLLNDEEFKQCGLRELKEILEVIG